MDIFELIKNRTCTRKYEDRPINKENLQKILEAGLYAPSPLNSQPWHFTLIKNKKTLEELAQYARHAPFISEAKLLIIVSVDTEIEIDNWLKQHNQHLYSAGACMQNMWLTANDLGIGCCWVSLDEDFTKDLILMPKEQTIIGALSLGYSQHPLKEHTPQDRKLLSHITSFEKFNLQENAEIQSCYTCLKLVPKSAANSFEGEYYIKYFCGDGCFEEWQKQTQQWLDDESK